MAIITLTEVKTFLQISGTAKDALITALIPEVQSEFIELNHYGFGTDLTPPVEDWPDGCKLPVSQAIGYLMASMTGSVGLKSESQGGYSYTKEDLGDSGYPKSIEKSLTKWRRVSVKNPQLMTQFRDRRLLTLKQLSDGVQVYDLPGVPIKLDLVP